MRRSIFTAAMTLVILLSNTSTSQACCFLPWLNPLTWFGCGYGCYNPCGYGRCGYPGYQAFGYQQPMYAAPQMMNYPIAPVSPGCGCTSALPQQQMSLTAVQVPVTSYRAVTQYVPQTTYQTQYRYAAQPAVAYSQQAAMFAQPSIAYSPGATSFEQPTMAYGQPMYGTPGSTYNTATIPMPDTSGMLQQGVAPVYSAPTVFGPSQSIATPIYSGDVNGDHEYPSQSAVTPQPIQWYQNRSAIRPASYGVGHESVKTYSGSVR